MRPTQKASPIIQSQISPPLLPAVSTEEVAFAIAIFVNAANQRISPFPGSALDSEAVRVCDQVFLELTRQAPLQTEAAKTEEAPLYKAFKVLWEQFEGDPNQAAVCARILAFHFLMERTHGAVVEIWLQDSPQTPETVVLDDAIVAAIGSVALAADGSLPDSEFLSTVRHHAQERARRVPIKHAVDPLELASRLMTLEAREAGLFEDDFAVASEICRKLRNYLSGVVGKDAYRLLLTRALTLATREEPALAAVRIFGDGVLECPDEAPLYAGKVLIAHIIKLQTTFIGEALVKNLLCELWPGLRVLKIPSPISAKPFIC